MTGNLIISRTPFRMPLGGGGTDLPSYYTKYGGFFISGALNKYMHIVLNDRFEDGIRVSYSKTEIVRYPHEIVHPSVRETLKLLKKGDKVEIVSLADIPASTGLGSSGSFTVGLLNAIYARLRVVKTPEQIAEEACDIAMNRLHEPSGKQDEYIASLGELESGLMMFYTGIQRSASQVLDKQQKHVATNKDNAIEKMHKIKAIGIESKKVLESGDLKRFGELLHEHWVLKRGVTDNMTTDKIDMLYSIARKHGALGGKIAGAGGGGFLVIYAEDHRHEIRAALTKEGLVEHRFRFDFEGSKVVYNI